MIDSRAEIRAGDRFAFGSNWRAFIELVDEPRIQAAVESLVKALGTRDLAGRSFLDAGCGSGLFSLAASRLGARVRSFDFDPDSVAATMELRDRFAPDADWSVETGSILDEPFVKGLGLFDIVYSWGVLHHTGDLWGAVDAAAGLVAPGGLLYISIYNDQGLESRVWRRVKRQYNKSGPVARGVLVAASAAYIGRRRPARKALEILRKDGLPARPPRVRGMSAKHDLVDWVGGYPFEVARPEEVFAFLRDRGFALCHLTTCGGGLGCNEYVFQRAEG
ncbi:class I SAM-dependent methyltransferase [Actinomadura viridis]|uniref:class I SAM-dependent methyltransferase n=1 Tax=Actinomadura viridis TaxID=58110 RepID=UPI0036CBBB94